MANNIMAAEIITREDLQLFKIELLTEIKALLQNQSKAPDEWLRSSQVRKMLNISPNTLQALRVRGKLNYTKVGSIFYYKLEELRHLLDAWKTDE